jgi:glycosyltransferase involved in cell wall biosynthesis
MVSRPAFKAFVANSQRHKRLLEDEGICGDKIIEAHGAVDLSQFEKLDELSASERTRNELCKSVVYAGSLYPGRGIEQMLAAAAVLKDVNFICIGGRDFEVAQHKNQTGAKRLTNVSFVGYVPNKEVPSYLTSADILVAPYTNQCEAIDGTLTIDYASPMKLFEYMAAGKPIVASGIGAIRDVLQHEQNALLVREGSVDDIVDSIRRLLGDPHLAVKLGRAARENAKTYSWEARCSRILRFADARKR